MRRKQLACTVAEHRSRGRASMRESKSADDVLLHVAAFVIWAAAFGFVLVHFR
jgi:hypothetical protein